MLCGGKEIDRDGVTSHPEWRPRRLRRGSHDCHLIEEKHLSPKHCGYGSGGQSPNCCRRSGFCANCGGPNHIYKDCNHPVTSFGIVAVRLVPGKDNVLEPQYMMVQRKDSLSYGTFMRGKYSISMKPYLVQLFSNMTSSERNGLQQYSFDTLWKQLWQVDTCNSHMKEYEDARAKFEMLVKGYYIRSASPTNQRTNKDSEQLTFVSLATLLAETQPPVDDETEWGFPKGRRNINEDDLSCAVREYSEETSIAPAYLRIVHPCKPFEEVFTGGNGIRYRHVYYLASICDPVLCDPVTVKLEPGNRMQKREVRSVNWFTFNEAIAKMRPQNVERRELFKRIHSIVVKSML